MNSRMRRHIKASTCRRSSSLDSVQAAHGAKETASIACEAACMRSCGSPKDGLVYALAIHPPGSFRRWEHMGRELVDEAVEQLAAFASPARVRAFATLDEYEAH